MNDQELHGYSQNAQPQLWNLLLSFINSMSLKCAVELGIPDIIHSHAQTPINITDLAASIPIPPNKTSQFRRLMRLLVHSNVFSVHKREDGDEGFLLTPMSRILVTSNDNNGGNLSPFVSMMVDPSLVSPWHFLGQWLKGNDTQGTPFRMCHGEEMWDWANKYPDFNKKFNMAMVCDSQYLMKIIVKKCATAFEGKRSLIDVGGGTGGAARSIAEAFPDIQEVSVLDLPHVVAGLPNDSRVKFVGGDMFHTIPPADVVLLKAIFHGWNDEECIKILKNCKKAIPSKEEGGKVMILDMVVNSAPGDHMITEDQYFMDLMMITYARGLERDENEWKKLFKDAGFTSYKITHGLGTSSLIELYP
uniref:KOMT2 n=1 Tax=Piper methysticum TaxID=130404 RepID=A0A4Y5QNK5_9MAGN|nr:KOMT2 [Piper methysticum]